MEDASVPDGWSRMLRNGRIVYSTPASTYQPSVMIRSRAELLEFHDKGRYHDVKAEQLVFSTKRKRKQSDCKVKQSDLVKRNDLVSLEMQITPSESGDTKEYSAAGSQLYNDTHSLNEISDYSTNNECTISEVQRNKLRREQDRLAIAVEKLTIDPSKKVDHQAW